MSHISLIFEDHKHATIMVYQQVEEFDDNNYCRQLTPKDGEILKNLYCALGAKVACETECNGGTIYEDVKILLPKQYTDLVAVTLSLLAVLEHRHDYQNQLPEMWEEESHKEQGCLHS